MASTSTPERKHRSRSILVVGDKTRQILSVSLLLQKFRFAVQNANGIAEAVERISLAVPDLVITDQALPGASGMDLFHLLRKTKRTGSVPVVFMIPMTDAASERLCRETGAAGCITKPVLAEDLFRTVQAALEPVPREDIRIGTRAPVYVNNVPLGCDGGACDIDLSERGMYVPMDKPYPQNRRITVRFQIKDRAISADSAVLYSNTSGRAPNKAPGMGLKFINIEPGDREFIRNYIREELTRDFDELMPKGSHRTW
jgi:CheY-like chemotaxis protein/Tfp pilus assembly protein PilZ